MVVKIIKKGSIERLNPTLYGHCNECGCEIECKTSDTTVVSDHRGLHLQFVECPTPECTTKIYNMSARVAPTHPMKDT